MSRSKLVVLLIATFALATRVVSAQSPPLAPTASHGAGRSTDTGFASVSNLGGYHTSIPLDLPPARGGTALPIALGYGGGRRVGAAGIGWDLPLSFVRVDTSFAHRRPTFRQGAPLGREQVTVSVAGSTTAMVPSRDSYGVSIWVTRDDAPSLILSKAADNTWHMRDGNRHEFVFGRAIATVDNDLWLLTSITSPSGRIELQYSVGSRSFPNDQGVNCFGQSGVDCAQGVGLEIDLTHIYYNSHPTSANCWKNEVLLEYGSDRNEPLSVSMLSSVPVVRSHTLASVTAFARPSCGTAAQQIRRYELAYDDDPDTGSPRLRAVSMKGKAGSTPLPIARYEYGTAQSGTGMRYEAAPSIALPAAVLSAQGTTPTADIEFETIQHDGANITHDGATWRNLIDVTGDGRPDIVFRKNGQLWVARNYPSGSDARFDTPVQLGDSVFSGLPLASQTDYTTQRDPHIFVFRNDAWRKAIDINGDGRLDVIDAREAPNKWAIYLNTPGTAGTLVTWVKRVISVQPVRDALSARGHDIRGDYVPLSRLTTSRDVELTECWRWSPADNDWYLDDVTNCTDGIPPPPPRAVRGEKTIADWDLMDINGDGYPDLVFNQAPAGHYFKPDRPSDNDDDWPFRRSFAHSRTFRVGPTADGYPGGISVLMNKAGVRIGEESLFSAATPISPSSACGIATWEDNEFGKQTNLCSIQDVNGDGLADRIEGVVVTLGDGRSLVASAVTLRLPGNIDLANPRRQTCADGTNPGDMFRVNRSTGLRDLTGDGIPDYVGSGFADPDGDGAYSSVRGLWIGTGIGFRFANVGENIASATDENCGGTLSRTVGGLYDLDGDGRA